MKKTIKYDNNKPRFSLIPIDALMKVMDVYMIGSVKYGDYNYKHGIEYSRIYDAMIRHIFDSMNGNDIDEDSKCFHLASVAWGCMTLIHYTMNGIGTDDRANINVENMYNEKYAENFKHNIENYKNTGDKH